VRAAVQLARGEPLRLADVRVDAPGPREVLVRTAAAGVCHSDAFALEGRFPFALPAVMGHESAGVVEAVGADVTYVAPGDHVTTCLSVFCGACEMCVSGRPYLCDKEATRRRPGEPPRLELDGAAIHAFEELGSFAEQLLVHEHAVVKIDRAMPLEVAALLGCGVTTGLGAVLNTARVPAGATVAVVGCGGVGLSAVQGARICGAARIIAVDTQPAKLELARSLGATDAVDATAGDPAAQVLELTGGGVEFSFEAVGSAATAEQAFGMLRAGGTCTVIGVLAGATVTLDGMALNWERRIQGSLMGSNRFRVDIPRYVELYLQGRLRLDDLVSARISLEELVGSIGTLHGGGTTRTVVTFQREERR
jgi:S-(hydroxymethyl)glutathione dehydrogenase/alcohol dehydrogenase